MVSLLKSTKLGELLDAYPFLVDFLQSVSPKYRRLKNPIFRRTMASRATLERIAEMGEMSVEDLIAAIQAEVARQTGDPKEARKEALKSILRDLHEGVDIEILRRHFAELVIDVSASEIAEIEQSLIDEGLPEEEVKRLCDVHVEVFRHSLDEQEVPRPPDGHPVHTLMVENRASENIMVEIEALIGEPSTLGEHMAELGALVERLGEIEKHYLRKENQLFPRLEAKGMSGPSQVMWAIHDDIRAVLKKASAQMEEGDVGVAGTLDELIVTIRDMIYKEENILFPMSMEALTTEDWLKVKEGEEEIGYAWIEPLVDWSPKIEEAPQVDAAPPAGEVKAELDVGSLTHEQINLVLTHLPIDITYVDEDDKVAYYSQGKERIFPRSPGIIGRAVEKCHPPKSVHVVEKIVEAFKSGESDVASFWIDLSGRLVQIRYFAVRDDEGNYRGTLEVSQDVTDIKKLEGEKRLLDWE